MKDGLQTECKECRKKSAGIWAKANRRARNAIQRKSYAANAEKRRETEREYRANNKEKLSAKQKAYFERNPEASRKAQLKHKFNMTIAEFEVMLATQGGHCKFCPATTADGTGKRLHIDHCHKTGKIRGLLCSNHNRALGHFQDDSAALRLAADYIDFHASTSPDPML